MRIVRRLDLVMVMLLCLVTSGCIAALRREPEPDTTRVAFLGIDKAPPAIERTVAERIDPGYERVSSEEYREAARKLQAETMTDLDVARVSRELDIDVVVHGKYVRKNRRRGRVEVLVRTAATGAVVSEYVIPVRRGAVTRHGQRKLDSELRAELEALLGPPPAPPAQVVAAVGEAPDRADDQAEHVDGAGAKTARAEPTNGRPEPAPARVTPAAARSEPAAAARPGKPKTTMSEKPATSGDAVVRNQPAPVIRQDRNGQVIDDEQPPGL